MVVDFYFCIEKQISVESAVMAFQSGRIIRFTSWGTPCGGSGEFIISWSFMKVSSSPKCVRNVLIRSEPKDSVKEAKESSIHAGVSNGASIMKNDYRLYS